jgi:hypothetical protein
MTRNLALAASTMMLVAISGQAIASTAAPNTGYLPEVTGPTDRQGVCRYVEPALLSSVDELSRCRHRARPSLPPNLADSRHQ